MRSFPFELLRPGVPTRPAFTVSEIPHRAKLDQNESPIDVPAAIKNQLCAAMLDQHLNRYPQPTRYAEIKERFAAAVGQHPDRIILTAGGDQMILLAFLAAGGPGRRARIFEPTYPMFTSYAEMTSTETDRVVLGARFDIRANGLGDPVDLLILVTPNNPTGNGPDRETIKEALERPCLVFVDEAYTNYSGQTVTDLIDAHPNLLISRSLSKTLLAGVRLGYGVGHPDLINVLERLIFAPYHLNVLQLVIAEKFELFAPHVSGAVDAVVRERERMQKRLSDLGAQVWPSQANFILFEVPDANGTYRHLLTQGVRVRDVSSMPGLNNHLRVTVGTTEENDLFLEAMARAPLIQPRTGA